MERKILEEVHVHDVIFMPVAEPYRFHSGVFTELLEAIPVRSGIDQYPCAFNVDGMAEGISSSPFARDKPDRPEMFLFQRNPFPPGTKGH
jgi:hypothetical protein